MKKLLLSLFVGFVGIISFCSAGSFSYTGQIGDNSIMLIPQKGLSKNITVNCEFIPSVSSCEGQWQLKWNFTYLYGNSTSPTAGSSDQSSWIFYDCSTTTTFSYDFSTYSFPPWASNFMGVSSFNITSFWVPVPINYTCTFEGNGIVSAGGSCPECPTCDPQYTSEQCQNVYGLVSSGQLTTCENNYNSCQSDLNSCQSNTSGFNDQLNNCNLSLNACNSSLSNCLQYNCPDIELSYSKFYVKHGSNNWFNLTGAENYYVYLPDFLGYNFEYSNGTDLNFTVGVATDTGYINNISAIQNSKPSQEDLNKLVSEVLPLFIPGLAVILLLYFIFRFIKKVF